MEAEDIPNVQNACEAATESADQTQTALDEDVSNQTAVQQTQGDICSDQETQPSSPSEREKQDRFSTHEQETVEPVDDVGQSTATGEILS